MLFYYVARLRYCQQQLQSEDRRSPDFPRRPRAPELEKTVRFNLQFTQDPADQIIVATAREEMRH